jgi:hypothetical protein
MPEDKTELTDGQRLKILEERIGLHDAFQEKHLKAIQLIFSLSSVLLIILAAFARNDVATTTKDLEHRFELLAGQTLKRPVLVIMYEGHPLDGRILDFKDSANHQLILSDIELKNTGDGPTTSLLTGKLYLSKRMQVSGHQVPLMLVEDKVDEDYGRGFSQAWFWSGTFNISPHQTWWILRPLAWFDPPQTAPIEVKVRLVIFYGTENPATADFKIRFLQP